MAHWLAKRPIFGASDKILDGLTEAWCIAKMKRLVGPIDPPVKPEYAEDFETADYLESESFQTPEMNKRKKFITVGTIRQELERLPADTISKECIDFIESLLIIDHTKRPSARDALKHPFITGMD
jgi:serine/threonine protein kinase